MTDTPLRRLRQLDAIPVDQLRHIGEKRAAALASLEINSVFDLLTTYPRRYLDLTRRVDLSDLTVGEEAAVFGEVTRAASRRTRQGRSMVEVTVSDGDDSLSIVFFNQAWRERQLAVGVRALFFAKVAEYRGRRQMTNPVVDVVVGARGEERDPTRVGRMAAIYPASGRAGLTSWEIGGFVEESLRRAGPLLDPLGAEVRARLDLVDRTAAYWGIHLPQDPADVAPARRRLVFDEFLRLQLLLALRRRRVEEASAGIAHRVDLGDLDVAPGAAGEAASLVARFISGHRHPLTGAQHRVLGEIGRDLASPVPMHRLLQGDVGIGQDPGGGRDAARGGRRGVPGRADGADRGARRAARRLAAPRPGRASSVADDAVLGGRPLRRRQLTGRLRARERRDVLERLAAGVVDIVVGTHALLTEDVRFRALGVVVIDEQHRFGVEQRATLRDKGRAHSSAGARPGPARDDRDADPAHGGDGGLRRPGPLGARRDAPRAPPDRHDVGARAPRGRRGVGAGSRRGGRRAARVRHLPPGRRLRGVVAASAVNERDRLVAGELEGLRVGLLHGQMPSAQKEEVMDRFRTGGLDVLVATVVIEVGVDVPEASVVVIEDAWRFGLAQLHQLRGRVGRGEAASYCFVLGEAPSDEAAARLVTFASTGDGFALAEADLDQRGEGTLLGTRQQGRSDLRLASLRHDEDLLVSARDVAAEMVAVDELASQPDLVDELRLFVDDDEAGYLFKS